GRCSCWSEGAYDFVTLQSRTGRALCHKAQSGANTIEDDLMRPNGTFLRATDRANSAVVTSGWTAATCLPSRSRRGRQPAAGPLGGRGTDLASESVISLPEDTMTMWNPNPEPTQRLSGNPAGTDPSIQQLDSLLRGEISATETYRMAINAVDDSPDKA